MVYRKICISVRDSARGGSGVFLEEDEPERASVKLWNAVLRPFDATRNGENGHSLTVEMNKCMPWSARTNAS